jgi:hypothetical protein
VFIIFDEVHHNGVMSVKANGKPANTATQGGLREILRGVVESRRQCGFLAMTGTPIRKNVAHDMGALCSFFPFPRKAKQESFWTFNASDPEGWIKQLPKLLDQSTPGHRDYVPGVFPYIIRNSKQTLAETGAVDDEAADKNGKRPDFDYDAHNPLHRRKKVGPLYSYVYTYTIDPAEQARVEFLVQTKKFNYLQRTTDCSTLSITPSEAQLLTGVDHVELMDSSKKETFPKGKIRNHRRGSRAHS